MWASSQFSDSSIWVSFGPVSAGGIDARQSPHGVRPAVRSAGHRYCSYFSFWATIFVFIAGKIPQDILDMRLWEAEHSPWQTLPFKIHPHKYNLHKCMSQQAHTHTQRRPSGSHVCRAVKCLVSSIEHMQSRWF